MNPLTTVANATSPLDYIPQIARARAEQLAAEKADTRRRLFCIGLSGSGKSFSTITTAPNPVALEYDNQLTDPRVKSALRGVWSLNDPTWLKENKIPDGDPGVVLLRLLQNELKQLPANYTVVIDSLTAIADIAERVLWDATPVSAKTKEKDGYAFWELFADFFCDLCTDLSKLPCNVVLNAHEKEVRDEETGRVLNYGWLLGGQKFTPRFPQFFTDVVRQIRETEIVDGVVRTKYMWQIHPTREFPYAKTRCNTKKLLIPADWNELMK